MDGTWTMPPEVLALGALAAPALLVGLTSLLGWWIGRDGACRRRRLAVLAFVLCGVVASVLLVGLVLITIDVSGGEKPSPLFIETTPAFRLGIDLLGVGVWLVPIDGLVGGLFVAVLLATAALGARPPSPNELVIIRLLGWLTGAAMVLVWLQALYLDGGTLVSVLMGRGPELGLGTDFFVSTLLEVAALAATVILVVVGRRHPTARAVGPWLVVAAVVVAELALVAAVAGVLSQGWVVRLLAWSAAAWLYGLTRLVLRHPLPPVTRVHLRRRWAPPWSPVPMPPASRPPPGPGRPSPVTFPPPPPPPPSP